jgi:hypothetical protein
MNSIPLNNGVDIPHTRSGPRLAGALAAPTRGLAER